MPRTYFSAEVKREAVDLVLQSRLPIGVAAQQIGCSTNALHNWLKKHRQQHSPPESPSFVPVTLIEPKVSSIEIVTPDGFTLRLTDASPKYIAELLHAIIPC
jgi:transposase-like protein